MAAFGLMVTLVLVVYRECCDCSPSSTIGASAGREKVRRLPRSRKRWFTASLAALFLSIAKARTATHIGQKRINVAAHLPYGFLLHLSAAMSRMTTMLDYCRFSQLCFTNKHYESCDWFRRRNRVFVAKRREVAHFKIRRRPCDKSAIRDRYLNDAGPRFRKGDGGL